jgi:hypothetical protein
MGRFVLMRLFAAVKPRAIKEAPMRKLLLSCVATVSGAAAVASLSPAMAQSTSQSAAPGTVTVRLNGRVNWYAGVEASSVDSLPDGTKTSTTGFLGYLRLYPCFDGVAANGLHYGAAAEIRINGANNGTSTSANNETLMCSRPMDILAYHSNQVDGDTFQLEPAGGSNAAGWLAGAQYTIGPAVVGASFFPSIRRATCQEGLMRAAAQRSLPLA